MVFELMIADPSVNIDIYSDASKNSHVRMTLIYLYRWRDRERTFPVELVMAN